MELIKMSMSKNDFNNYFDETQTKKFGMDIIDVFYEITNEYIIKDEDDKDIDYVDFSIIKDEQPLFVSRENTILKYENSDLLGQIEKLKKENEELTKENTANNESILDHEFRLIELEA